MTNWYDTYNFLENINIESYQLTNISNFIDNYVLHDSYIIDVVSKFNDLFIVLLIDPMFTKELKKYETAMVQEWPILILYFPKVEEIQIKYDQNQEFGFEISTIEVNHNGDDFFDTLLTSVFFHTIKIKHSNELYVKLFDKHKNIIKLNKI